MTATPAHSADIISRAEHLAKRLAVEASALPAEVTAYPESLRADLIAARDLGGEMFPEDVRIYPVYHRHRSLYHEAREALKFMNSVTSWSAKEPHSQRQAERWVRLIGNRRKAVLNHLEETIVYLRNVGQES